MTLEEWRRSLDSEGRSLSPEPIRERIFRGVGAGPKGGGRGLRVAFCRGGAEVGRANKRIRGRGFKGVGVV